MPVSGRVGNRSWEVNATIPADIRGARLDVVAVSKKERQRTEAKWRFAISSKPGAMLLALGFFFRSIRVDTLVNFGITRVPFGRLRGKRAARTENQDAKER